MKVIEVGPWLGPTTEEWVQRIAAPSTPAGQTVPWIKRPERVEKPSGKGSSPAAL